MSLFSNHILRWLSFEVPQLLKHNLHQQHLFKHHTSRPAGSLSHHSFASWTYSSSLQLALIHPLGQAVAQMMESGSVVLYSDAFYCCLSLLPWWVLHKMRLKTRYRGWMRCCCFLWHRCRWFPAKSLRTGSMKVQLAKRHHYHTLNL